jgi:hypothetical protein
LSYSLLTAPSNAVIDGNGVISWTPIAAQVPSTNVITTVITDFNPLAITAQHLSATNTFTVTVSAIHNGPVLAAQTNRTISELSTLVVANTASDSDIPALTVSYQLIGAPAGATINTNGLISWTPSEAQGPSTNTFTTVATDSGNLPLSATNSFTVVVNDLNTAPILPPQTDRTIIGLASLVVTNTASDADLPANSFSYTLLTAPSNAVINDNGLISWTPTSLEAPSTNVFETVVTDYNPWAVNEQNLSATNIFTVTVINPIHNGPILAAQPDRTFDELSILIVTNTANDTDIPALALTYELITAPAGATINSNGVISWTPTETQGPTTNTFTAVVTDSGNPPLSATNSFSVVVNEINSAPVLPVQTNRTINGLATLIVTNTATDADLPSNSLFYTLLTGPTNAVIDGNGVITWTPELSQFPGTTVFETIVTDENPSAINEQHLSATNTFTVITEIHNGPVLAAQPDRTVEELSVLIVTNSASAADLPALSLAYQLINPPAGATIDTNGVITWNVEEAQGPSKTVITTVVTDNGLPPLSATNSFTVTVNELNSAPVLPLQSDRTINGLATLVVTNAAIDTDIPVNGLNYTLLAAPTNAVIGANGVITWTPIVAQVPSTNIFETMVTDYNPWASDEQHLSATNSFVVVVASVHNAPALPIQTNHTILEHTTLTVTNAASSDDIPPLPLIYELASPPAGASIDADGVITWTPSETQCPTTNVITTVVSDGEIGIGLSATNSFLVFVRAPILTPTIESIFVSNGMATITWTALAGRNYRLQYKDDLGESNWTDVLPDVPAEGATVSGTNSVEASSQRFYRVFLVP